MVANVYDAEVCSKTTQKVSAPGRNAWLSPTPKQAVYDFTPVKSTRHQPLCHRDLDPFAGSAYPIRKGFLFAATSPWPLQTQRTI